LSTETIEYRAPWIIAYQAGSHKVLRDGAIAVTDGEITYVGRRGEVHSDKVVETNNIIAPGFISMHSHMHESPVDKGIAEDIDKRQFWSTNLIEILPPRSEALTRTDREVCTRVSIAEHLRTGTTTVMQMGPDSEYIAQECERVGLRAYIAESYRSGSWYTDNGKTVEYSWLDDDGQQDFDRAVDFATRRVNTDRSSLITGFLNPSQVDTCSEELLLQTEEVSAKFDLLIQIHAAQSYSEFYEMTRRHGKTPIEWLDGIGVLNERMIIGHGLFVTGSSWTNFPGDDVGLISAAGTAVAYNPWVFARNGIAMETFDTYRTRGTSVLLGTDTTTQSMLHSMRWASIITKVLEKRSDAGLAAEVFNAATVEAADVLRRNDLGRIEVGAKADLTFWRTDSLFMTPTRDPIRSIVFYAEAEDIEATMVNGKIVMRDGEVSGLDTAQDLRELQRTAERMWSGWQKHDWAGRTIDQHIEPVYGEYDM
jgi:5-methylthioadenosine/S-adenosylhomocysteine deaminase